MNFLDVIYGVVMVVAAPWWMRKKRSGRRERLGHTPPLPPKSRKPRIMLHAVSVGEVSALRSLIPLLTEQAEVVVSVGTDTGIARAQSLYADVCTVVRYPLDFSRCTRRFLDAVEPDAVALVELEVWPNFIREANRRHIPVAVINGRLSAKSFRGYRRLRPLLRKTFASLSIVAAQDEVYQSRFIDMGVAESQCVATGSMKWDAVDLDRAAAGVSDEARDIAASLGIDLHRMVVVAGSTADEEEALLHRACPQGVQLVCAPRKPERFDEAADAMPGCVRRSAPGSGDRSAGRFLLDSIGELGAVYELADVVVIGRSFTLLGGSDPTEPIALGKPVVIGPSVEHFASIVETLKSAGAIVQTQAAGLTEALAGLCADEPARSRLVAAGLACVQREQGASARHAAILRELAENKTRAL